jgi:glycosyltransferase involved in cell wall biosynthesis
MKRRILHVIGQLVRGGSERQLLCLSEALAERGWKQTVVTLNPGDVWEEPLRAGGVRLLPIPRTSFKLRRLQLLRTIIGTERPAIVHSWSNHTNVYTHWASINEKVCRIVSLRSDPMIGFMDHPMAPVLRAINARTYAAADCVISNSRAAISRVLEAGVKVRRAEVVGNIVKANGRANAGESAPLPRIVAAGWLIPLKAYDVLLRALAYVARDGHSFELVLAGDGPERSRLESLALELGLQSRTTFAGDIDDVPRLMASAHLLVHPSRSEGLSNTILETMAEGVPVVATDVGSTKELVKDGETGFLVPADEPALLADRIKRLLESPALRSRLGQAGLALVSNNYSPSIVAGQYERIYESVMDGM